MRDPLLIDVTGQGHRHARPGELSYLLFMTYVGVLAFGVAVAYYLTGDLPAVQGTLYLLDVLFALIFLLDFFVRLARAGDRSAYFMRLGWLDLLTSVPGLPFLRIIRAVRLLDTRRRLLATTPAEVIAEARARLGESTLLVVFGAGLLVLTVGTIAIVYFEAPDPAATIDTGGDALWWALVTVATVGYGDMVPITPQGRIVGAFMIVLGVALFTVLTSFLATIFLAHDRVAGRGSAPDGPAADQAQALRELTARIAALEAALRQPMDEDGAKGNGGQTGS